MLRFEVRLWQASRYIDTIHKTKSNKLKGQKKSIQRSAMHSFSANITYKLTFPCFNVLYFPFFSTCCLKHYLMSLLKPAPIVVQLSWCPFPAMLREWKEGLLQFQVVKWLVENGNKWREKDLLKCKLKCYEIMDHFTCCFLLHCM